MKKIILYFVIFFCSLDIICAQTSFLDPSFGNHGIVRTDMGSPVDYHSAGSQVLTGTNGSIYIIYSNPTLISKRKGDGSPDSSYGLNGYTDPISVSAAFAALQPDGKIVIAGSEFTIARINANGTPDSTFGSNSLQAALDPNLIAGGLAIQADGKIVVAGTYSINAENYFAVARFNSNGNPDNTFNTNGEVITDFGFKRPPEHGETDSVPIHDQSARAIVIQADGKIVVGGYATNAFGVDFAVARYNINGHADSTFDSDGLITTDFGFMDEGNSLALESDGRIVLAGYASNGSGNNIGIVRYKTDGNRDSSFNGDGIRVTNYNPSAQSGLSVAIQNDDKIVVATSTLTSPNNNDFEVLRFNGDGTPDNTFDGDGVLTTDFRSSDDYPVSLAVEADNKILVAGYLYVYSPTPVQLHLAVSRYNTDGSLDDSFADHGKLEGISKQGYTVFYAHATQSDGKVVAVGQTSNGNDLDFGIARYNTNGTIDSTFSSDGVQLTDFGGQDGATSVAIQPDGKIVVAGNDDGQRFAVARYNADGTPDNTFNGNGKLVIAMGFADYCQSVALQKDGKIVLAGFSFIDAGFDSSLFAVARINANGTPDITFSGDGKQFTDLGSHADFASSVAIQPNGKIVVTGRSYINNQNHFSIARYNTTGDLDNTFSGDGIQTNAFGPDDDYFGEAMALQPDGKIVMSGYSQPLVSPTNTSFVVARYTAAGDLDNTFSEDGFQTTLAGGDFSGARSIAVNSDGRIAVGGSNRNFTIVLYKADGNPDSTFGNNGIVVTDVRGASSIQSLSFLDNKLYAVGDGQFPGEMGVVARYILPQGGSLPVSLLDFTGTLRDKSVLLQWKVATEKDLAKYVIERSPDGIRFLPINSVASKGSGSFTRDYSMVDDQPFQGINFYRLKMVDTDAKFTYSNVVAVKINTGNKLMIFPNPAQIILFVEASGNNENALVQVVDASGRKMKEMKVSLNGITSFSIDISGLSSGFYSLLLRRNGKTEVRTFIKK